MESGPPLNFPATSFRDLYAKSVIANAQQQILDGGLELPPIIDPDIFKGRRKKTPIPFPLPLPPPLPIKVGIIGAGAAGLYAALILDSMDISYEILEANSLNKRAGGGRIYTHYFKGGPNDYYDVGAMRFPKIPFMKRVFDLIMPGAYPDPRPPKSPIAAQLDVIPYVMDNDNNLVQVNHICYTNAQLKNAGNDPFKIGMSPDNADKMVINAIGDFKAAIREDFTAGWAKLMEYDAYSTRGYMMEQEGYSSWEVDLLELFTTSTSLFDCALAETVMDSLDFNYDDSGKPNDWYCIQGGAGKIIDAMIKVCKGPIFNGYRVTAIVPTLEDDDVSRSVNIIYTSGGESMQKRFDHVISTIPLGALSLVDTAECKFDPKLQTAIRALHYDASVKVAIQFTERWWETYKSIKGYPHKGGISTTDQPTRTVVYPSYGIDGTGGVGTTIIVSYTWAQDALRLGCLVNSSKEILLETVLKDLSDMHRIPLVVLTDMVKAHHMYDWYSDEYSMGAFALFGPGQFKTLYPEVTKPPAGRVHLAGEATSVHHAWVVGAFNSAYRTIYEILCAEGDEARLKMLQDIWGTVDELDHRLLKYQVALGQELVMPRPV